MIVYKFGGTVLLDVNRVCNLIIEGIKKHRKLVVVTSAIGRYPKPYATDTLAKMGEYVSEEERARLLAFGEIISSIRLSNELQKHHILAKAIWPYDINLTYDEKYSVDSKINDYVDKYDVVIVPGFIGIKNNNLIILPRGGSNITASYLAFYFHCNLIIFTDVDGVYPANPKNHTSANKYILVNIESLKKIIKENPTFFPIEGIQYLKQANLYILVRNLENSNGSIIGNFQKSISIEKKKDYN